VGGCSGPGAELLNGKARGGTSGALLNSPVVSLHYGVAREVSAMWQGCYSKMSDLLENESTGGLLLLPRLFQSCVVCSQACARSPCCSRYAPTHCRKRTSFNPNSVSTDPKCSWGSSEARRSPRPQTLPFLTLLQRLTLCCHVFLVFYNQHQTQTGLSG